MIKRFAFNLAEIVGEMSEKAIDHAIVASDFQDVLAQNVSLASDAMNDYRRFPKTA